MKRSTKIILAAVAAITTIAPAANAGLILTTTRDAAAVTYNGASYDRISFKVVGFDGADATAPGATFGASSTPQGVSSLGGTFTASDGANIALPGAGTLTNGTTAANGSAIYANTTTAGTAANKSFTTFDLRFGTLLVGGAAGTSPNRTGTSFRGDWGTLNDFARVRPTDLTVGDDDDGIDNTILASILVSSGGNVSFSGTYNTFTQVGGSIQFTSAVQAGPSIGLTAGGTGATIIPGNGVSYIATVLAGNVFQFAGSNTGSTLVAFEFDGTGVPAGLTLPTGATASASAAALAPFAGLGEDFDFVVDFGVIGSGPFTLNLGGGFSASAIAVVPEPSVIGLLAPLGLLAARRRK